MANSYNIFDFENRIDDLFETIYPLCPPGVAKHPSGRAYKPIFESALGALVPNGNQSRRLQDLREYVKVDFQDFVEYATSDLCKQPELNHFSESVFVNYVLSRASRRDMRLIMVT